MLNATAGPIAGTLFLHLFSNGTVQAQFLPRGLDGTTRPMFCSDTDTVRTNLTTVFRLSTDEAQAAVRRLVRDGYAELAISMDESRLQVFFRSR
jgi:hypothetical protein